MTRRRRPNHEPRYRGVRWVTVTCRCGWISANHRSRGEAFRSYTGHLWLADNPRWATFGIDARRAGS